VAWSPLRITSGSSSSSSGEVAALRGDQESGDEFPLPARSAGWAGAAPLIRRRARLAVRQENGQIELKHRIAPKKPKGNKWLIE
jgi:hypothetical protein